MIMIKDYINNVDDNVFNLIDKYKTIICRRTVNSINIRKILFYNKKDENIDIDKI